MIVQKNAVIGNYSECIFPRVPCNMQHLKTNEKKTRQLTRNERTSSNICSNRTYFFSEVNRIAVRFWFLDGFLCLFVRDNLS